MTDVIDSQRDVPLRLSDQAIPVLHTKSMREAKSPSKYLAYSANE